MDPHQVGPLEISTTCPYCGVGCGVLVKPSSDGLSAEVRGDPDHPSNWGKLCSKGAALGETLGQEERLLFPEVGGKGVAWETATDLVARKFRETIAEHGPDSVAFYVSGQILTEDYYVANKLMKGFIGSGNIDTNSRLCMASSVAGHKRAFGMDTVPGCYEDLDETDLAILVGSNFAWCHPVLHQRLLAAKQERGTRIVVIDPRETATSEAADLHLPLKPGSDVALFNWLFSELAFSSARNDEYINAHTEGLEGALQSAKQLKVSDVQRQTGLLESQLDCLLRWIRETPRTMTIYSQGVNQSTAGSDKVNAILNMHLVTGRIGTPGAGPFSITGQPNAMGGREVGGLANQLAAHMGFDPTEVNRVQRFWKSPTIASEPGLKAVDMFDAVHDGRIKAIWIMATNPVVSMPNADKVKEALRRCAFVVVSDVVATGDTVKLADVKLPATAWGEKAGTVTNSERRVSRQRRFLRPPGETRPDWLALSQVAQKMGFDGFTFESPADVYREHAMLSGFENDDRRDFDISADAEITDAEYASLTPYQWPKRRSGSSIGRALKRAHRFFADGKFYTPSRKARFVTTSFRPPATTPGKHAPLILNTGRLRDHWHTMTRTGLAARLSAHVAEPFIEIHPSDAQFRGISDADLVTVKNALGHIHLRALITERVKRGEVFAPIHWTDRFASNGRVDKLIGSATDPVSGQQESKYTPVELVRLDTDLFGFAVLRDEPARSVLDKLSYWCLARTETGWRLEFAGESSAFAAVRKRLLGGEADVELSDAGVTERYARFVGGRLAAAIFASYAGPVAVDRAWLSTVLDQAEGSDLDRFSLLAGRAASGQGRGRLICSCYSIGSEQIKAAISSGAGSVDLIGNETGAGTNCGSCKPEIKRILEAQVAPDDVAEVAAE